MDQSHASENQQESHDQCTQDAPVQDPGLVKGRDVEVTEYHYKDEHVVHGQALLDDVAGQKLHGPFGAHVEVNAAVEKQGQRNP